MQNRYAGLVLASLGLVTLAAAAPKSDEDRREAQRDVAITKSLSEIAEALNRTPAPDPITQPCVDGRERRESDLCAQWKAADAAEESANAAWLFGLLGSLIGTATLIAAIQAARYARRAAVATEATVGAAEQSAETAQQALAIAARNADAATDQVRVSEATAQRQLRAYVGLERIYMRDIEIGKAPGAVLDIRNFGQTPAHKYDVHSFVMLAPKDAPEDLFSLPTEFRDVQSSLAPGATGHAYPRLGALWNEELQQAFASGQLALHVFGQIPYEDVFGTKRTTTFRVYHDVNCAPGITYHSSTGNEQA